MNNIISLKSLRQDVQGYADKVKKGKEFIVLKKNKPIFKLTPVEDENWETLIDFTEIKKGGVNIDDLLERL
jgi:antitoxin (DNA-binding transcriptional repressor) of toxin-antitoxin stability system